MDGQLGQNKRLHLLKEQLGHAHSSDDWLSIAKDIDVTDGAEEWRIQPDTQDLYDYRLIESRTRSLRNARHQGRIDIIAQELREGLIRNLGNIGNWRLYARSLCGTKYHIEEYVEEVVYDLLLVESARDVPYLTKQRKIDIFHDTRQAFGITALVLYGGATFGLYHLGVVRALYYQGLLPRVISGTAVGALIAALIGTHTDSEMPELFNSKGYELGRFSLHDQRETPRIKLVRFLSKGYFMNVNILEDCVKAIVGNLTFEEAYRKTRRILNITVSTTRTDIPQLLNFITTPNVLICTAALASNALTGGSSSQVELLCKDHRGDVVPWSTTEVQWRKWNSRRKDEYSLPAAHMRMGELFNVNHYIVSQANPYMNPFMHIRRSTRPGPATGFVGREMIMVTLVKIVSLILGEIRLRMMQLNLVGLLPNWGRDFLTREKLSGDVTILPRLSIGDLQTMMTSTPDGQALDYWILKGEQATWPLLAELRIRLAIEKTLDGAYTRLSEPSAASRIHSRPPSLRRQSVDARIQEDRRNGHAPPAVFTHRSSMP